MYRLFLVQSKMLSSHFWERVAHSVTRMFSLYNVYLLFLVTSRFDFEWIWILISLVPGHCLLVSFTFVGVMVCNLAHKCNNDGSNSFVVVNHLLPIIAVLSEIKMLKVEDRSKQLRLNHVFHEIAPQYLNQHFLE